VLKKHGVKKGDRVAVYLPMIAELPVVMLACARIGAIHMVVFGGFSAEALKSRIDNCGAKVLICANKGHRGGKTTPSKTNADVALSGETTVEKVIVVKRVDGDVPMTEGRDVWYHDEMAAADITADCPPAPVDAEHPLFILYTSGSTGTPKGVLHSTGGYLLYVHDTLKYVFNLHDDDIHFCTADIGWVTGHSYIVYGPLACGATSILFEGLPTYPEPDRFWQSSRSTTPPPSIRPRPSSAALSARATSGPRSTRWRPCASWVRSASRSTPTAGSGTTRMSARAASRCATRGGRPRPAAS